MRLKDYDARVFCKRCLTERNVMQKVQFAEPNRFTKAWLRRKPVCPKCGAYGHVGNWIEIVSWHEAAEYLQTLEDKVSNLRDTLVALM